jgi:hypothetical protein
LHREGNGEIHSDQGGFTRAQRGQERGGGAVNLAARAFDDFAISVVDEAVNYERTDLA